MWDDVGGVGTYCSLTSCPVCGPPVPLTLRSMLSSQVSLVFEGLPARGWSTMQVGPCSALAIEEKSSQEDKSEFSHVG